MPDKHFDVYIQQQIAAKRTLRWLMGRIFENESPEEARELLRQLAQKWAADDHDTPAEEAFRFYRGMRSALDEDDFRWGSLIGMSAAVGGNPTQRSQAAPGVKLERSARLTQYKRHRQLFELEIKLARKTQKRSMALTKDWSHLEGYLRDTVLMTKAIWMLWFAGVLFRFELPGAGDVCDAAAFELFRSVYLAAA